MAIDLATVASSQFDDDEPRLCPRETPDKYGQGPDSVGRAYENQVKRVVNPVRTTPSGFGMALINPTSGNAVMFDDCQQTTGAMIEAKGPTFTKILREEVKSPSPNWGVVKDAMGQSEREVQAAGSRPVVWYFADQFAADYFATRFQKMDQGRERIIIRVLPYDGSRR